MKSIRRRVEALWADHAMRAVPGISKKEADAFFDTLFGWGTPEELMLLNEIAVRATNNDKHFVDGDEATFDEIFETVCARKAAGGEPPSGPEPLNFWPDGRRPKNWTNGWTE